MTIDSIFAEFPQLTTDRLLLRQIHPSDADDLFAILSDAEIVRYYGRSPQQTIDETRATIQRFYDHFARRTGIRWGVILRETDLLIGTCGLFYFDEDFNRAEIGYELNTAYWGKGLMTEAVSAILTFAFRDMGLHRVEANIDIANERSKALLLKLGFTYEGRLRERYVAKNGFDDEHYFGLLTHEWKPTQR